MKNHKFRKKLLSLLGVGLSDGGWLSLMYYLWINPDVAGVILSVALIIGGDILLALIE